MMTDDMFVRINQRLPEELLEGLEASAPQTSVRGIHPNWRVARYHAGQTFPAHQVLHSISYVVLNFFFLWLLCKSFLQFDTHDVVVTYSGLLPPCRFQVLCVCW